MAKDNASVSMDEMDDMDDIITLAASDGEEIDFYEVAGIVYGDGYYAILQPVELLDGMQEDEALVFRVYDNEDGSQRYEVEVGDEIIDAVFDEYNKLLDEADGADGDDN